ncbi:MAG: hypothetical protein ACOY45_02895 [Pseudomonadota bacterium]
MRSTLAARLSFSGADVITASSVDDPLLARHVREPAILIVDEASADGELQAWVTALRAMRSWGRIIVIVGEGTRIDDTEPPVAFVPRARAMADIPAIVARWRQ